MTIASSIHRGYKSDDTIGLDELLDKCKAEATNIEYDGHITVYTFEDYSWIVHNVLTNAVSAWPDRCDISLSL